jgi:hypothetical protein
MAYHISTYAHEQVTKFSNTLERLSELQLVTSECNFIEALQASWMLREHFMTIAEKQWDELSGLLLKEILPLVADIKSVNIK